MSFSVDLNCDMGESFRSSPSPTDDELMKYITSANVACGFHSGDFAVMQRTVLSAKKHRVVIGAHPSLPDLEGFGRRTMDVTPAEVYEMTLYQIGALHAFTKTNECELHHVKPHGALYNMAAKDRKLADAIVDAMIAFDPRLILYGLANSTLIDAARSKQLSFCQEVFSDRTYQVDGSLTPRNEKNALIENSEDALQQVMTMITQRTVSTLQGKFIPIEPGTICIHSDGTHAVEFARAINQTLTSSGVRLAPPLRP